MPLVYLGLGTNLGDRLANLEQALQALAPQVHVLRASSVYQTQPWGYLDQPAFLNQVLQAETLLSPLRLLNKLKRIEKQLGREVTFRYGPRLIDLDILSYDDLILHTKRLEIPHPRLHERAFVLAPLAELDPDWVHPLLGRTISALLADLDQQGVEVFC